MAEPRLEEEKLYQAVYWAVRDVFESALEEAARRLSEGREVTKGAVLLNIIYEAIKEGAYRAIREALVSELGGVRKLLEQRR